MTDDTAKTTAKSTAPAVTEAAEEGRGLRPGEYLDEAKAPPSNDFKGSKFSSTAGAPADADKGQGTYVEDIPAPAKPEGEAAPVNPGNEAPDVVGRQPTESAEEAGERIAAESKEADKAAAKTEEKK
jgi:hypothetical protein